MIFVSILTSSRFIKMIFPAGPAPFPFLLLSTSIRERLFISQFLGGVRILHYDFPNRLNLDSTFRCRLGKKNKFLCFCNGIFFIIYVVIVLFSKARSHLILSNIFEHFLSIFIAYFFSFSIYSLYSLLDF